MEPKTADFILYGRLFQQETNKMRNLLIVACCAALVGSVSVASAQTTGPTSQDTMKTNPMDSNAKVKKSKTKKSTKSDDSMKSDATKDSTKK